VENIATLKMFMIHSIFGEDNKVLKSGETDELKMFKNIEELEIEEENWDTKYLNFLDSFVYNTNSQTGLPSLETIQNLPSKLKLARSKEITLQKSQNQPEQVDILNFSSGKKDLLDTQNSNSYLLFAKKGKNFVFKYRNQLGQQTDLTPEVALEIFGATPQEKSLEISEGFYEVYESLKSHLFVKTTQNSKADKGKIETMRLINLLSQTFENSSTQEQIKYLGDLEQCIVEYDALPDYLLKFIRDIPKKLNKKLNNLEDKQNILLSIQKAIPPIYLQKIQDMVKNQDQNPEAVLVCEEFQN
jgi:hypothetical protein